MKSTLPALSGMAALAAIGGSSFYWLGAPSTPGRTIAGISRWPDRQSFLTSRREKRTRRNIAKRGGGR